MTQKKEDDLKIYTRDIPVLEASDSRRGVFNTLFLQMGNLILQPELIKEPTKAVFMFNHLVSMIPDENLRKGLRAKMKERKIELTQEFKKEKGSDVLTNMEKDFITAESAIESIGFVEDYCDSMVGEAKFNKIGYVYAPSQKSVVFPNEVTEENDYDEDDIEE